MPSVQLRYVACSCVRAFLLAAIASHVSRIICLWRTLFRRGSRRAIPEAAARLRIACCTSAAWHASHICVPSCPEGRLDVKFEKWCRDRRWWQTAHFQEPRVLVWHCKHSRRLRSFVCQAIWLKYSFVYFMWHRKHSFLASHDEQTRYRLHRGF